MQPKSPKDLTQGRLKEVLHYDPETGFFTWRIKAGRCSAGAMANSLNAAGYIQISIDGGRHYGHRLAILYVTGIWPSEQVDHINGIKGDNRWVNLRQVSPSENNHNIGRLPRHNTSGFLGVHFHKAMGRYLASITVNNKQCVIGYYGTPELAHAAYMMAKDNMHPTHRRLRVAR